MRATTTAARGSTPFARSRNARAGCTGRIRSDGGSGTRRTRSSPRTRPTATVSSRSATFASSATSFVGSPDPVGGAGAAGMKFGIGLSVQHLPEDSQAARFQEHVEQVRLARAVGFTSVWASQHYLSDPFTYFQPIPTLARVAAEARGMTLGTGCLLLPLHHPVEIAEQLATLPTPGPQLALFRRTRAELRRPAATETPLIKECYVAPESSTALAEAAAFLDAKYRAYRRWEQDKALPAGESFDTSFAELARDRFLIGDPARVADEIARYRDRLGVTTLIFRLQWPGMGQEQVLRSIRLLGTKVLPKFS